MRLDSLTGLRFYAALIVVIDHTLAALFPGAWLTKAFSLGGVGVSFFFILSGFVLTWSRDERQGAHHFWRNRFARVYPLHALTWLGAGLIILAGDESVSVPAALAALLLIQSWSPDPDVYFAMNGPSWSLSDEAFFYAAFPFLAPRVLRRSKDFLIRAIPLAVVGVAMGTLAMHVLLPQGTTVTYLYINPVYRIWEFVFGIALAALMRSGLSRVPSLRWAVAAVVAGLVLIATLHVLLVEGLGIFEGVLPAGIPTHFASLALVPLFAWLIIAAAQCDRAEEGSHFSRAEIVTLGRWSFGLYLAHYPIIMVLEDMSPDNWVNQVRLVVIIVVIGSSIVVSGLLHKFVEAPIERRLRVRRESRRAN